MLGKREKRTSEVQGGQRPVDLQALADCLGALVADLVVCRAEGGAGERVEALPVQVGLESRQTEAEKSKNNRKTYSGGLR